MVTEADVIELRERTKVRILKIRQRNREERELRRAEARLPELQGDKPDS